MILLSFMPSGVIYFEVHYLWIFAVYLLLVYVVFICHEIMSGGYCSTTSIFKSEVSLMGKSNRGSLLSVFCILIYTVCSLVLFIV